MTQHDDSGSARPVRHPGGRATLAGRSVARIGYGAMQLERLRDDEPAAVRLVEHAVDVGVSHIDTSQFYGNGFANDVLRRALTGDDSVTVVTKVGADPDPGGPMPMRSAQRPAELRASVEANLRALGVERLPLVNLRRMDTTHAVPGPPDQTVDIDDQLAEMSAMRAEGLIGAIGLSSTTLDKLRRALPVGLGCVQNAYSLLDRADEPMLELCERHDVAWVPYFPLGGAFPGTPKVTEDATVAAVARRLQVTPTQVGLAWLLAHSPHVLLIPGTSSVSHLDANLAAGDVVLDAEVMTALDGLGDPADG